LEVQDHTLEAQDLMEGQVHIQVKDNTPVVNNTLVLEALIRANTADQDVPQACPDHIKTIQDKCRATHIRANIRAIHTIPGSSILASTRDTSSIRDTPGTLTIQDNNNNKWDRPVNMNC